MLSRAHRIGAQVFPLIMRNGKAIHAPHLSVRVLSVPELTVPRFAVVVSKKVDKRAVYRNRMRRKVYAALRTVRADSVFRPAYYIFSPKPGSLELAVRDWAAEITQLIKK